MAENKKSFVLYSDWCGMFNALPDDVAGKLIKHTFLYVNDENPTTDDFVINALFEQIKATLKRDLKKWELQQEQRRLAGIRSAEVRKQNSTRVNERSISSTDSVSVSVNGNVNDFLLEKETKGDLLESSESNKKPEKEKEKKVAPKKEKEITLPFGFSEIWDLWLEYRNQRKLKNYAGDKFEQMAIDKLVKFSNGNPEIAKEIINESITNNWTGFFELKNNNNGKQTTTATSFPKN